MRTILEKTVILLPAILYGCGGGVEADEPPYKVKTGDSFTYSTTRTPTGTTSGTATTDWYTRYMLSVGQDGSFTTIETSNGSRIEFDTNSKYQQTRWVSDYISCLNSPQVDGPELPLYVGKAWNVKYTRICNGTTSATSIEVISEGSVVGIESITVPAGTFDVYKLVYKNTVSTPSGKTIYDYTCWRHKDFARTVSCDYTSSISPANSTIPSSGYAYQQRLEGLDIAGYQESKPIVARFAGDWRLTWNGTNSGSCDLTVSINGFISGDCASSGSPSGSYRLTGLVSADGGLSASITSGALISGKFKSPIDASGTWVNTGSSGSWSASHR